MPPNIVPGRPPQRGQRIDQGLFHTYSIGPAAGGPGGGPPGIGNPQMIDPQQQKRRIPPGGAGPGPGVEGGALFGGMVAGMGAAVFNGLGVGTGAMLPGIGMGQGGFSAATFAPDPTPAGIRILDSGVWELTVPMGVPPLQFQDAITGGPGDDRIGSGVPIEGAIDDWGPGLPDPGPCAEWELTVQECKDLAREDVRTHFSKAILQFKDAGRKLNQFEGMNLKSFKDMMIWFRRMGLTVVGELGKGVVSGGGEHALACATVHFEIRNRSRAWA